MDRHICIFATKTLSLYTVSEKQILKYQMPFLKEKESEYTNKSVTTHRKRYGKSSDR